MHDSSGFVPHAFQHEIMAYKARQALPNENVQETLTSNRRMVIVQAEPSCPAEKSATSEGSTILNWDVPCEPFPTRWEGWRAASLQPRADPLNSARERLKRIIHAWVELPRIVVPIPQESKSHIRHLTDPEDHQAKLAELVTLQRGWDGEDAAPPSEIAVNAAQLIVKRVTPNLRISEIEADVIGGLTIWVVLPNTGGEDGDRWVWFSVRNSGKILLVLDLHRPGGHLSVSAVDDLAGAFDKARAFLSGITSEANNEPRR